jgi:hypothetical protein
VAELQALAASRADLLAEVAGIFEGASEGEPDEPLARARRAAVPDGRGRPRGDPGMGGRGQAPEGGPAAVLRRLTLGSGSQECGAHLLLCLCSDLRTLAPGMPGDNPLYHPVGAGARRCHLVL